MNKALFALLLTLSTLPAMAQRMPRGGQCTVVAVDRYNRVIAHFYGHSNPGNGVCRDALRNCNYEIRRRGWWDARCAQVRGRNW